MTPIKIPKVRITHPQRAWIRKVLNDDEIKPKKEKVKVKVTTIKLKTSNNVKQMKLKKRIYDLKYYWDNKADINHRQRRNYHLHKIDTNTKFI
tara:strand:+ start:169 stop:447 length:279 start_codon:yes stop_codon:yes gene_type:complete